MVCVWCNQNSHIIHLSQGLWQLFAHVKYQLIFCDHTEGIIKTRVSVRSVRFEVRHSLHASAPCKRARVIVNFLLSVSGMTSRKSFRRSRAAGARRACATAVKRRQRKKERNIFLWMWLRYGRISSRHVMACKIAAVITTGYQPDAVKKHIIMTQQSHLFWVDTFYSVACGEYPPTVIIRALLVRLGLV